MVFAAKGLVGTLLRYPYEVRDPKEYFDENQDVKVTKDMLDLAPHIVEKKAGRFEPDRFEDQYETALIELINQKRSGKPIVPKERRAAGNVADLMEALRRSVGHEAAPAKTSKPAKTPRGRSEGDADANRWQEAGKGERGKEVSDKAAPELCLTRQKAQS